MWNNVNAGLETEVISVPTSTRWHYRLTFAYIENKSWNLEVWSTVNYYSVFVEIQLKSVL
jgi:hypothetical protein